MTRVHGHKTINRRNAIDKRSHYSLYIPELKEDFCAICGYCGKSIKVTKNTFEPDHFIPKRIAPGKEHDYTNLVYSCWQCNRKKTGKWPTNNPNMSHDGKIGFVDPATSEYDEHLKREVGGKIVAKSELGEYLIDTFKFNLRPIKEIWKAMNLFEKQEVLGSLCESGNITNPEILDLSKNINELTGMLSLFFDKKE